MSKSYYSDKIAVSESGVVYPEMPDEFPGLYDVVKYNLDLENAPKLYKPKIDIYERIISSPPYNIVSHKNPLTKTTPSQVVDYLYKPEHSGICGRLSVRYLANKLQDPYNYKIYITTKDGTSNVPITMLAWSFVGSNVHIIAICTNKSDPSFRGGGVLIDILQEFCIQGNIPYITLYALKTAEDFYKHKGFFYAERNGKYLTDSGEFGEGESDIGNRAMIWRNPRFNFNEYDKSRFSLTKDIILSPPLREEERDADIALNEYVNRMIQNMPRVIYKFKNYIRPEPSMIGDASYSSEDDLSDFELSTDLPEEISGDSEDVDEDSGDSHRSKRLKTGGPSTSELGGGKMSRRKTKSKKTQRKLKKSHRKIKKTQRKLKKRTRKYKYN